MNSLHEFLAANNVEDLQDTFKPGGRFKDMEFTIRAMTSDEFSSYQKQCVQNANSIKKRTVDNKKLNNLMLINHCVEPNFRDAEFLKKIGAATPEQAPAKVLLAGEVQSIAARILSLSGFNEDAMEEAVDDAKNS